MTATAKKPAKSIFFDTFKSNTDIAAAKAAGDDLDNFTKYPVYRALQFSKDREPEIKKLCRGLDTTAIADGQWVMEVPDMKGKIEYDIISDGGFQENFTKYSAAGILGCGTGSERF